MTEKLVFNRFLYMKLSCMRDGDSLHDPSVREVEIFNDGMVLISELEKGFGLFAESWGIGSILSWGC